MVVVVDFHVVATDDVGADDQDKAEHQEEKDATFLCPPREDKMEEVRAIGQRERDEPEDVEVGKIQNRFGAGDFPCPAKYPFVGVFEPKGNEEEGGNVGRVAEDHAEKIDSPPPPKPHFARGRGSFRFGGLGLRGAHDGLVVARRGGESNAVVARDRRARGEVMLAAPAAVRTQLSPSPSGRRLPRTRRRAAEVKMGQDRSLTLRG